MHFLDQLKDRGQIQEYEAVLAQLARFVEDCARLVTDAYELAQKRTYTEKKYHHATILLLMRHVVEAVDGVSVLVAKGSAENCGPLLRSGFEALASILYILKADTERRALAYQVAHIHKKIKLYRKFIPTDNLGRNIRADLIDDPLVSIFDQPGIDWQKMIENLENTFSKPEYAPIQAEWERLKEARRGSQDPHWYALFGGPSDLRKLALQVGKGSSYEILYRHWSDFAHASGAFNNISKGSVAGVAIKPVRCPEGIEQVCNFAAQISIETVMSVVKAVVSDMWPHFQQRYINDLRPRLGEILTRKIIKINWEPPPTSST
jgi:hypothetical protein